METSNVTAKWASEVHLLSKDLLRRGELIWVSGHADLQWGHHQQQAGLWA